MTQTVTADELIAKAQAATGLEKFDSDSFREGLDILLSDYNASGASANERLQGSMVMSLANRLKTTDYLEKNPELLQRPIEKPVFVFGVPRTGTTLLSNLLATDPARRSPLTWEIDDPVPPATDATLTTDPRAVARLEMEAKMLAAMPEMGKYYRSSAIYPNEDVYIMAHDFKTLMWESRGKCANYRDWLLSTDMTSAYEYHKRYLQVLQHHTTGTWNLKMPSHSLFLETLLKVYPDARLVLTHRDPLTATGSFCGIISQGHGSVGPVDAEYIGQNCLYQAVEHANRVMDFRDKFGEDRVIDVHYADLMNDPISAMRKLYAGLGDDFTAEAQQGMQDWLDDNPQNKFGKHEYKLSQYGLDESQVRDAFERYSSRYDVEPEGC
ncbi:sulfotransferase [Pseudomaricurvus sp. HS19]|uniref:sulfotransferase family protein n=1 Tax=Pseudomaricurvus sp. HS19 TaxID=2692626 RepID=UPI00136C60EA|nr:sulfotransferase [Pseudomaricurvus sp. HS19]MYM64168.1 sulfotransferase [Pseudomaricurvus sp. HS19]